MHYFFSLILLFISASTVAQNNTQVPEVNNNSTKNSYNTISTGEPQQDSVKILEELEIENTTKKAKSVSKEYKGSADKSIKSEASDEMSEKAVSSSFTYTKQQSSSQRTQRSPSAIQQKQMNQVVDQLEENSPESFEYNYFKYVAGNYDVSLIDHLKKAEVLRPANSDVQIQMAAYYMIINDKTNALLYLEKLVSSTRLNKDVIDYAEDLLQSAPKNQVLITHGFDDSYATAYVQLSKNIRTDVKLISLDFLQSEKYRQNLTAEGYKLPVRTTIDVQYFKEFCINNSVKTLSISLTTPKEYLTPIQQNLFVVGLVFEYHTDLTFNNFDRNDELWNEVLTKKIIDNATNEKAKQLSSNYLPMLLVLRKVYSERSQTDKVQEIDEALDKVSVQCKKYDQVQKLKSSY